jgi:hypothetical protein
MDRADGVVPTMPGLQKRSRMRLNGFIRR